MNIAEYIRKKSPKKVNFISLGLFEAPFVDILKKSLYEDDLEPNQINFIFSLEKINKNMKNDFNLFIFKAGTIKNNDVLTLQKYSKTFDFSLEGIIVVN